MYGDPDSKDKADKEAAQAAKIASGGSSGSLASLGGAASSAASKASAAAAEAAAEREETVGALCKALCEEEVFPLLLTHMRAVDFEVRKAMAAVFNAFVRGDTLGFTAPGGYLSSHTALLYQLFDGYTSPDVALVCGSMARECIKIPHLHEHLLVGPDGGLSQPLRALFEEAVHDPNFEVSADAFETLQALLTTNKTLVFRCLNPSGGDACLARYTDFMQLYGLLLTSDNYVLKRQSLRLLSEFLLDRENFRIMMKFISDKNNLKVIMGLMRHKQPAVQFEAFHVFKVFVANPDKPADIAEILGANKQKLIFFLQVCASTPCAQPCRANPRYHPPPSLPPSRSQSFQNDKEDEQFAEEKTMLIDTLAQLADVALPTQPPAVTPRQSSIDGSVAGVVSGMAGMGVGAGGAAGGPVGSEAGGYSHQ